MDAIDLLLKEVDEMKAKRQLNLETNQAIELPAREESNWYPEAVVAIFESTTCKNCGTTHIHPRPGPTLVRYRNIKKKNEIWESATPFGLVPNNLPEAVRYFCSESEVCHECFGMNYEEE